MNIYIIYTICITFGFIGCVFYIFNNLNKINNKNIQIKDIENSLNEKISYTKILEFKIQNLNEKIFDMKNMEQSFKSELIESSKNAAIFASREITTNLLKENDNKLNNFELKNQETVKRINLELSQQLQSITKSVHTLNQDIVKRSTDIDILKNVLSSSSNIGIESESILENTLRRFGLRKDIDYITQHSVTDENFTTIRPDAVVFLPNDTALVIDSKASKHIFEIGDALSTKDEVKYQESLKNLKNTMNTHLKSLLTKEYSTKIKKYFKKIKQYDHIKNISMIMWLPTDSTLEKLNQADPSFVQNAASSNIYICGPTGLWTAIGIAKNSIMLEKQLSNQEKILEEASGLLDAIANVSKKAGKVEKSLKSAVVGWNDFAKSFDKQIIKKSKNINKLGIENNKEIVQITSSEDSDNI